MSFPKLIGYYSNWSIYSKKFELDNLPLHKLTHINYAFAKLDPDFTLQPSDPWADLERPSPLDSNILGNYNQLNDLNGVVRRTNPNLKTLISVGGWTFSNLFSDCCKDLQTRTKFVDSCVQFLLQYKFDGIDLDWEFPVDGGNEHNGRCPEDGLNLLYLVQQLRQALSNHKTQFGGDFLITLAVSASPYFYRHYKLAEMASVCDWFNLMAYDFSGSWSNSIEYHSNLFPHLQCSSNLSGDRAIQDYLKAGVPPSKLVLGVPYYGRGFQGFDLHCTPNQPILSEHLPLGQKYEKLPSNTPEEGVYQYKEIHQLLQRHPHQWTLVYDNQAAAVALLNLEEKTVIFYDDPTTLTWKAEYIKRMGLGGIMVWEMYGDHQTVLTDAIIQSFIK